MPDYRTMFDSEYLGSWDLQGREATVTISAVTTGNLVGLGGRKARKPILSFEGKEKGLCCGKTICRVIAAAYGTVTEGWVGKRVVLYVDKTTLAGEIVDCIRVKIPVDET